MRNALRQGTAPLPPVVLLCGGLGLRQRADGDDLPKPLRRLPDGRALLLHVLDYYRAFGLTEFVLCVGYGAQAVRELLHAEFRGRAGEAEPPDGVRITIVDSGPAAGKCARLLDARVHVGTRPFLLGYSDVLSDFDLGALADRHESAEGLLTLAATRVRSRYGELNVDPAMAVTDFAEKPVQPVLISAGYFLCAPGLFDLLDPDRDFEADVIPKLVERRAVHAVIHDGPWLALDTYKDFLDLEEFVEREGWPWLKPI